MCPPPSWGGVGVPDGEAAPEGPSTFSSCSRCISRCVTSGRRATSSAVIVVPSSARPDPRRHEVGVGRRGLNVPSVSARGLRPAAPGRPMPPISGAAADHGELKLTSADGTKFMAYFARAEKPTGAGMVVLPDVRGLHTFFKDLAQRFAEAGIDSVAIDYFARTAETDDRSDAFEYMPHVTQTTDENIAADAGAAMKYLRSQDGGAVKSLFTVGFCFGGSSSWNQSALHPDLNGCIGFYGTPMRRERLVPKLKTPLPVIIAGADPATPLEQSEEFVRKLEAAGVPVESHVYKDAPHSFFDRGFTQWKDACDDAWRRMLDFVKRHGS